jgi:hypothetical protein
MARILRAEDHPWPDVAAAVLAQRGRMAMDRETFAERLVLDPTAVAAIEDGAVDVVAPVLNWSSRLPGYWATAPTVKGRSTQSDRDLPWS